MVSRETRKTQRRFFNMIENEQYSYLNKKVDRENHFLKTSPHSITNIKLGQNIDGSDVDLWWIDRPHLMNTYFNVITETTFFIDVPDD